MRKRLLCGLLAALLLCSAAASSIPGMSDDPVVTKRFIDEEFLPSVSLRAAAKTEERFAGPLAQAQTILNQASGIELTYDISAIRRKALQRVDLYAAVPERVTLEAGTTLLLGQGTSLTPISGKLKKKDGALTDVTAGRDIAAGAVPEAYRLYLSSDAAVSVTVTEKATVLLCGYYRLSLPYAAMYRDLCNALITMGVVNTYELERDTVRLEMFIVYLTILGARQDAEAYTGIHPFTDVPPWADRYAAYLYGNGYVAGTGGNRFEPDTNGSVQQMCYLMLLALGYSDAEDGISYATAVSDAVRLKVFTKRETEVLQTEPFTRDALMYMTYYGLHANYKGGNETVLDRLVSKGQITREAANKALAAVVRTRIS